MEETNDKQYQKLKHFPRVTEARVRSLEKGNIEQFGEGSIL